MRLKLIVILLATIFAVTAEAQFPANEILTTIDNQHQDAHSFYDGTYIWYPFGNHDGDSVEETGEHSHLVRFNPSTNELIDYDLDEDLSCTNGTDRLMMPYHAIQDPDDINTIWLGGWYGYGDGGDHIVSLWKITLNSSRVPTACTYYSGDGKTFGGWGGKIIKWNGKIWVTAVYWTTVFSFDPSTQVFTRYTLENGATGDVAGNNFFWCYGLASDDHNLFLIGMDTSDTYDYIHVIPDNFTTNGSTTINTVTEGIPLTVYYLANSSMIEPFTGNASEDFQDLVFDGTDLWISGNDGSNNCIFKVTPNYTGNYVTSFGSSTKYSSGNGRTIVAPSIKYNDYYVAAVWEDSDTRNTFGWLFLDKTDSYSISKFNGTITNYSPWETEFWPSVTVELGKEGY